MTDSTGIGDFIFGTLATTADRLQSVIKERQALSTPVFELSEGTARITLTAGPEAPVESLMLYYTTDGSDPQPGAPGTLSLKLDESESPFWDTLVWGYIRRFSITLPNLPAVGTMIRYRVGGQGRRGEMYWAADGQRFSQVNVSTPVPDWVREAIIYHIFVDRFSPAGGRLFAEHENPSGFYGGTIRGITERLDYLSDLGVNCLWLSPIHPSPSHHGYDATDFREIEPRLGTKADLHDLVEAAHARGIRILLDFVPNHVSNRHPFFLSASTERDSPYREYFMFTQWPNQYKTFFGVASLPQINNDLPEARQYVIDSARYWLREFGVDGFRLDYANGPSHDFWADYYAAVKRANPESFHVGEIVETPELMRSYAGRMDGTLDFHFVAMMRKVFAYDTLDIEHFDDWLHRHEAYFRAENFILPTFLDNHDMNRFLWVANGDTDRLKLAALLQFTLAAPPIIYYGTEIGLSQQRDLRQGKRNVPEEARLPMPWSDQNLDLLAYYKHLITIRKAIRLALEAPRRTLLADERAYCYGYARANDDWMVIIAINHMAAEQTIELDTPGTWRDLIRDNTLTAPTKLAIRLPARSGAVLVNTANEA